jgi:hypothetical protein
MSENTEQRVDRVLAVGVAISEVRTSLNLVIVYSD